MGALSELSTAFGALRRNPILFAGAFIAAAIGSLGYLGQAVDQILAIFLSLGFVAISVFVTPFITGGLLGMAKESVANRTTLGTFLREGKANYLSLLGATLLYFAILLALTIAFGILFFLLAILGVGLSLGGAGDAASSIAGLGLGLGLLALGLVFFIGILVLVYFLQFYDTAIVVSDASATKSLGRSASFVRSNKLSALGFTLISIGISFVSSGPIFVSTFATAGTPAAVATPALETLIPAILITLVLSTLTSAFLYAYKVAFYVGQTDRAVAN